MKLALLLVSLAVIASAVCAGADVDGAGPLDLPQAQREESTAASPQQDSEVAAPPVAADDVSGGQEKGTEIEVEVVGKREGLLSISPAPGEQVSEVTAADIKDSGAKTVLDAIDLTPSVFVRHQGARYENRLSIRGQAPRLVLLDGIPIAREGRACPRACCSTGCRRPRTPLS
jgi:outer membrane receptor for ferrienterochelin and colicin